MSLTQITVAELALILEQQPESLQLIDVREPDEIEIAHISGFAVFPLSQFAQWSPEFTSKFNPDTETLVICHHGVRSLQMCQWLIHQGFNNVKNIEGGIDAYSLYIDPRVTRY